MDHAPVLLPERLALRRNRRLGRSLHVPTTMTRHRARAQPLAQPAPSTQTGTSPNHLIGSESPLPPLVMTAYGIALSEIPLPSIGSPPVEATSSTFSPHGGPLIRLACHTPRLPNSFDTLPAEASRLATPRGRRLPRASYQPCPNPQSIHNLPSRRDAKPDATAGHYRLQSLRDKATEQRTGRPRALLALTEKGRPHADAPLSSPALPGHWGIS